MSRGAHKPPRGGSSLTDAVVAALGKIDEEKTAQNALEPAPAEAGCAATKQGAPPMVSAPAAVRSNGFRSGPGSFADLVSRWAGGPGIAAPAPVAPPSEPPAVIVEAPSAPPSEPPAVVVEAAAVKAVGEPAPTPAEEPRASDSTLPDPERAPPAQPAAVVTPGGPVRIRYFGRTDVGLVREHNEDNFLVADVAAGTRNPSAPTETVLDPRGCVFAVCDGMGGAAAGEVASQMAVDTILEVMSAEPPPLDRDDFARRLVYAIEEAGHRIFSAAKMDRSRRGMGTTSTLAGLIDDTLFVGQVGDSRAYVLRGDELVLVTKDQSLVNQLIEAGQLTEEEAEAFEHSNIILQALGTTEEVTVDLTFLQLRRGDRLMMCSDGLSGLVHAEMIKEVLRDTKDQNEAASRLTQMANAGGGHDNITVIVADFDGDGLPAPDGAKACYQQYPLPPADDTVRGKSLPPRDMRMKAPGQKPGADVKRDDYVAPAAGEYAASSGGGAKIGVLLVVALLLLGAALAGWYFYGGGAAMLSGATGTSETPPPPPPRPTTGAERGAGEAQAGGATGTSPAAATGTVQVDTDVEEGTLFVNGEARGPVSDGMTLELAPGAYQLEVRDGEARLAGPESVSVSAGATSTVSLDQESIADEPAEATPDPPPPTTTEQGGSQQAGSTRRGGGEPRPTLPVPVVRPLAPPTTPPATRRGGTGGSVTPPPNPF